MDILTELINKIEEIDINKVLDEYFTKNKEFILDLNKEQLYEFGVRSDDTKIGDYKPSTVSYKKRKGQRHDHITLKDTGKFYDSFTLDFEGQELIFDAFPLKFAKISLKFNENSQPFRYGSKKKKRAVNLFEVYGIDILGLNEKSKDIMLLSIRDFIIKKYDEIMD